MLLCEVYRRENHTTGELVGRLLVDGLSVVGTVIPDLNRHVDHVRREAYGCVNSGLDMPALARIGDQSYLFVPQGEVPVPPVRKIVPPPLPKRSAIAARRD